MCMFVVKEVYCMRVCVVDFHLDLKKTIYIYIYTLI